MPWGVHCIRERHRKSKSPRRCCHRHINAMIILFRQIDTNPMTAWLKALLEASEDLDGSHLRLCRTHQIKR